MTRHQEIRTELQALYAKSAAATNERTIREIEHQIDLLEREAASILTDGSIVDLSNGKTVASEGSSRTLPGQAHD